jgi:hypothetical protein
MLAISRTGSSNDFTGPCLDRFRMPRKPGVEWNDQIGHFDDMPTTPQLGLVNNGWLAMCVKNGRLKANRTRYFRSALSV